MGIIGSIIIGGIAGWIASMIMHTKKSLFWYVILGLGGGLIGSVIHAISPIGGGVIMDLVFGIIGTCILIFVCRVILKKK